MAAPSLHRMARLSASCFSSTALRRSISVEASAVRHGSHVHAHTPGALKLETVKISSVGSSQVVVRMLAAPITPSDVSTIAGFGSRDATFPRVCGNEGVGRVEAVGSAVTDLKVGDTVVASSPGAGTWSSHAVSSSEAWTSIPADVTLPPELAAVSVSAPTLARAILDGLSLPRGSSILVTDAASGPGLALIQYAAARGLLPIAIARKSSGWSDIVYHLQGLGARIVVDDDYARTPAFKALVSDVPPIAAAVDAQGGRTATAALRVLANGATFVSHGNASGSGVRLSAEALLLRDIRVRGFNLDTYLRALSKASRDDVVRASVKDVAGGDAAACKLLVAREPFRDFAHALARSADAENNRTVVLTMQ